MNFLADESVDRSSVERLRQEGHQVAYIVEVGSGMPDDAVLQLANQTEALLLTANKDFGELVFRQHLHLHGVILIRLAGRSPAHKAETVVLALSEHLAELPHSFAVITSGMFRIRRG